MGEQLLEVIHRKKLTTAQYAQEIQSLATGCVWNNSALKAAYF